MKITIEITTEKMILLNQYLSNYDSINFAGLPKSEKKEVSLMIDVRKIFIKKTLNNLQNTKKIKVSMPYYLADSLHNYLQNILVNNEMLSVYIRTTIELVRNQLHQQLL